MRSQRPRRTPWAAALLLWAIAACAGRASSSELLPLPESADTGAVSIAGPTLIGFCPPPTRARAADSAFVRTLAEFQNGLARIRPAFDQAGVEVYEQYTDTLVVREQARGIQIYVPPAGQGLGYYLAAPGREPDILHGLKSEDELEQAAWRYFHGDATKRASR